tara:strand:- start:432 stop:665 length:234 start_codon:yes stop_codon:yes gene_type:complete
MSKLAEKNLQEQWEKVISNISDYDNKRAYYDEIVKEAEKLYLLPISEDNPFGSHLSEKGLEYVKKNFYAKFPKGWEE